MAFAAGHHPGRGDEHGVRHHAEGWQGHGGRRGRWRAGAAAVLRAFDNTLKVSSSLVEGFTPPNLAGVNLIGNYASGLSDGITQATGWLKRNLPYDPPALKFLGTPLGPPPPGVAPGVTPGIGLQVAQDPYLHGGHQPRPAAADLRSARHQHGAGGRCSFSLSVSESNRIQHLRQYVAADARPGETGMMNVCVAPFDRWG